MKRLFIIPFIMVLMILFSSSVSAENVYSIPIYASNETSVAKNPTYSLFAFTPATEDLYLDFRCYSNITGAGDSVCSYHAPLGNPVANAESSTYGNCVDFGSYTYEVTQLPDEIESGYFLTSSATSFFARGYTTLRVISPDDYLIFLQDSTKDDYNHVMNFLSNSSFEKEIANFPDWKNRHFSMYNGLTECSTTKLQPESLKGSGWACDGGGDGSWRTYYYTRFFPFNSSNAGSIRYNITKSSNICNVKSGGDCAGGYEIGYFEKGESETVITTGTSANGELSLNPNSHYVFYIASYVSGRGDGLGVGSCSISEGDYATEFNITIITPDWNCSDYGECVNGSQSRVCNDLTGKVTDKIESRFCYVAPENWVYLGFENYTTENVWYNYFGWWCACDSETKSILYPDGWTVTNPKVTIQNKDDKTGLLYDFIKMTSETAFEGDKSLKMWNIPPQMRIPETSTFLDILDTFKSGWLPATNYTNEGWLNPEYAFTNDDTTYAIGEANENITYYNFDLSTVPDTCLNLLNLTIRLDTLETTSPTTVYYECIKIKINDTWSNCLNITTLTVSEQTFLLNYESFADDYKVEHLKEDFQIKLELSGGTGTVELDFIAFEIEAYDPDDISFYYQDILCGNQTVGIFPDVYQSIDTDENTSIFVERNITLPTPFMSTSFKVKKCVEPELKFYATPICFDFDDNCYTTNEDCNYESKGRITFYLKQGDTFLYDITSEVSFPNKWEIREYAIDSLQPNQIYTIGLAVIPDNTVDPEYYCIYVDDVRFDIRTQPLVCVSECDNSNEIRRYCKEYDESGFCVVCEEIAIINSPNCLTSDLVIDKVQSCEDWCGCEEYPIGDTNYYTKYVGEFIENCNVSLHGIDKCCEYSEVPNSEFCEDFCTDWESGGAFDLFAPIPEVESTFEESGVPTWTARLLSPIMIIFYIMIAIMSFVTLKTGSWQIGVVTGLLILSGVATIFPQLLFIVILIIIVAGFILAKSIYPFANQ